MKILLFITIFFASFKCEAQTKTGPILVYNDQKILEIKNNLNMTMYNPSIPIDGFISGCITSIGVFEINGCVYVNWNSFDDTSEDTFLLLKSFGQSDTVLVDYTVNVPTPNMNILYSVKDKNFNFQSTFYNLFRNFNNGKRELIATIFIPVLESDSNEMILTNE